MKTKYTQDEQDVDCFLSSLIEIQVLFAATGFAREGPMRADYEGPRVTPTLLAIVSLRTRITFKFISIALIVKSPDG